MPKSVSLEVMMDSREVDAILNDLFSVLESDPETQNILAEANQEGYSDFDLYKAAELLRELAIKRSPVGIKKVRGIIVPSGKMMRSWSPVKKIGGKWSFSCGVPYYNVVEFGGYKGVGPRTVMVDGRIYSKQAVGGILQPVFRFLGVDNLNDAIIEMVSRMKAGQPELF